MMEVWKKLSTCSKHVSARGRDIQMQRFPEHASTIASMDQDLY